MREYGNTVRRRGLLAGALMLLVCAAAMGPATPSAAAWSNGPAGGNGFGKHDWVLIEAQRLAAARGVTWLRLPVALPRTDDPNTRLHDFYYHVFDVWGASHYGNAPLKVTRLYSLAVRKLRAGDRVGASSMFGLLAHYYADVCVPLHTDQTAAEERIHAFYERAAQLRTDARGEHRSWVRLDGSQTIGDAAAATRRAATFSHQYYAALVRECTRGGFTATAATITRRCLNRAANDLADLIVSARRAARAP